MSKVHPKAKESEILILRRFQLITLKKWLISFRRLSVGLRNGSCPRLSAETFKTFKQTSTAIPGLAEYLLLEVGLEYILAAKIQSVFLEKRFGRYRQLSGANYFGTERQFLEAEKSIRVKSLIKFSGYSIERVQFIMESRQSKMRN